jgi:PmbA protein
MIEINEIHIARECINIALAKGADAARISLNKSVSDSVAMLNGEVDKVSHSADRSLYFYIFADGRYGTFSTNRLDMDELVPFISNAIEMVKMLGEDACRTLPDPSRTAKDAITGQELGLYDAKYADKDADSRIASAESLSIYNEIISNPQEGFRLISEECEYTDSYDDTFLIDSNGFEGRHTETTFSAFAEMTIEDADGNKYSGFWWENSPMSDTLKIETIAKTALERATRQIGPKSRRGGHYKMVVDRTSASRLISPLITALNAASVQQKMSFLEDKIGEQVFSEGMNLIDMARSVGKSGSRLYDTEGVATQNRPIIENGVVKQYFVNTYMANKMGIQPTIEDMSRPCLMPYLKGKDLSDAEKEVSLKDILQICVNGIYVTGFNGGNCNPVTGDFSYGVEGFAFSKGKITHPVKEMLITGNIVELWNSLLAAGTDVRDSSRWYIPTLAFENVSFSA